MEVMDWSIVSRMISADPQAVSGLLSTLLCVLRQRPVLV